MGWWVSAHRSCKVHLKCALGGVSKRSIPKSIWYENRDPIWNLRHQGHRWKHNGCWETWQWHVHKDLSALHICISLTVLMFTKQHTQIRHGWNDLKKKKTKERLSLHTPETHQSERGRATTATSSTSADTCKGFKWSRFISFNHIKIPRMHRCGRVDTKPSHKSVKSELLC